MSFFKNFTNGDIKYYIERLEEFVRDLDYDHDYWVGDDLSDQLNRLLKNINKRIGKGNDGQRASKQLVKYMSLEEGEIVDLLDGSEFDDIKDEILKKRVSIKNTLKSRIRRRNLDDRDLGKSIYVSGKNYRYLDKCRKRLSKSKSKEASMNDVVSRLKKNA